MYTEGMTYDELRREYDRDHDQLDAKRYYLEEEFRQKVKSINSFPYTAYVDWRSKAGNKYILVFRFMDKSVRKRFVYYFLPIAMMSFSKGIYTFVKCMPDRFTNAQQGSLITPHFFARYAERTGQTFKSPEECRRVFFSRNYPFEVQHFAKPVKGTDNIHYSIFGTCKEGVMLGNYDENNEENNYFYTFVTYEMLSNNQTEIANLEKGGAEELFERIQLYNKSIAFKR